MPETVAVPTVVPPVVQVVGAVAWGPKTLMVIVPPAPLVAPDSTELIEVAVIAVFVVPAEGALAVLVVVALPTTVVAIRAPQVLFEALLLASPP